MTTEIKLDDFSERKPDRDLGLDVDGKVFWVSRKELADTSSVFNTMLYGQFEESQKEIIRLPEKKAKEILEFLRCLFPAAGVESKNVVNEGNVDLLLSLADEYEIGKLTKKCSEFLMAKVRKAATRIETIDFFVTGVRYKLKDVVRNTIWAARKSATNEISGFDEMPPEVRTAVTMKVPPRKNNHKREQRPRMYTVEFYSNCEYCDEYVGEGKRPFAKGNCPVCHDCSGKFQSDDNMEPWEICKCVGWSVLEKLMKVGL